MSFPTEDQALFREMQRLLESSSLFAALMDSTDSGVALITPDLRIAAANATLQQWFPGAAADGHPSCHASLYGCTPDACHDCPALRCMETGSREETLLAWGEERTACRVSCTPLYDAGGGLLGVLEVSRKIGAGDGSDHELQQYTARLEEKVRERTAELTASQLILQQKIAELDSANRELKINRDRLIRSEKLAAVGEMSATVAHGIRNPLVSVGGFARRLIKKEHTDDMSVKYLRIIIDEIDRLEIILSELLDFVRPRKLELRKVCLGSVIEESLKGFAGEFSHHGILVETSFRPDIPELEIDTDQFRHVLQNLFSNSIDAMADGGTLHISTCMQDGQAKIAIADTGEGIGDGDVEKVFHPFYTTKPSGTGLGLAVCNQIIAIHGGHIKMERRLPRGVVFEVYLPLPRAEGTAASF